MPCYLAPASLPGHGPPSSARRRPPKGPKESFTLLFQTFLPSGLQSRRDRVLGARALELLLRTEASVVTHALRIQLLTDCKVIAHEQCGFRMQPLITPSFSPRFRHMQVSQQYALRATACALDGSECTDSVRELEAAFARGKTTISCEGGLSDMGVLTCHLPGAGDFRAAWLTDKNGRCFHWKRESQQDHFADGQTDSRVGRGRLRGASRLQLPPTEIGFFKSCCTEDHTQHKP